MLLLAAHVHRLVVANAKHRSGRRLQELSDAEIFNHLHGEVVELAKAPDDIDEMGDILGIVYHLAHRRGWSTKRMEEAAIRKLAARFSVDREADDEGEKFS